MRVVDCADVAGAKFDSHDPTIFSEVRGDGERRVCIGQVFRCFDRERLLHRDDGIGLADDPAIGVVRRWRQVFRIAFFGTGGDPFANSGDLGVMQTAIVAVVAHRGIGVPWRHAARGDRFPNGGDPGPRVLISHERHGRHRVGTVALGATGEEDRCDVFRVGELPRRWGLGLNRKRHERQNERQATEHFPSISHAQKYDHKFSIGIFSFVCNNMRSRCGGMGGWAMLVFCQEAVLPHGGRMAGKVSKPRPRKGCSVGTRKAKERKRDASAD